MTYRIRDWDAHFEKSQTRKCTAMKWVPVSNKHDGKSYRRLMRMERRAEVYAVWVLLIQVASKCPTRGVLADSDGPLTPDDLELKTGMPAESFAYAMPVLASDAIGWLATDCDETTSTLPADSQHATTAVVADYQHATSTLPPDYQHGGAPVGLQDRTGQDKTRQEIPPLPPEGEPDGWGEVIDDLRANEVLTADSVVADLRARKRPLPWAKAMVDRFQNFRQPQGWTPGMLVKLLQTSIAEPDVCLPVRATVLTSDPIAEEAARQRERDKRRPERLKRFGAILDAYTSEKRMALLADQPASVQNMAKASEPRWKTCRLTSDLMLESLEKSSTPT